MPKSIAFYFSVLLAVLAAMGISCKKDNPVQPTPPGHTAITLTADFVSLRWTRLSWNNDSGAASHKYVLLRNGKDTVFNASTPASQKTVTVQDSMLTPGTDYSYEVLRIVNTAHWDSASVAVRTKDTTKDAYSWTTVKYGYPNSVFYGIWGTSPTSLWIVGAVDSGSWVATIIHRTMGRDTLFDVVGPTSRYYGVFGTSDTDVYFCGPSVITHWDGKKLGYHVFDGDSLFQAGTLSAIWEAPDKKELFAVGSFGLIIHRKSDGKTWEQMTSGTTMTLVSIRAFSRSDIYVCGQGATTGIILHFDGSSWQTVAIGDPSPPDSTYLWGRFICLAGEAPDSLYAVGTKIYRRLGGHWMLAKAPWNEPGDPTGGALKEGADGVWNNLWVSGDFGFLMHFNGERWTTNYPFWNTAGDLFLDRALSFDSDVFIVGSDNQAAYLIHGK
jgi:hypothetical protein